MIAYFTDGHLSHLDVSGNVQAIYLPMESDSTYNKIGNITGSFLAADFDGNSIKKMSVWPEPNGTLTPIYLAKKNSYYLPQFKWYEKLRPTSPDDIFIIPEEMENLFKTPDLSIRRRKSN